MKKIVVLIIISALVNFSCKKKTKKTSETNTPIEVPVVVPDEFSVKVDSTDFSCKGCSSSFFTGGLRGIYFSNPAPANQSFRFYFDAVPKPGTYQLRETSDPRMTYVNGSTQYSLTSGVLNITAIDTSSNGKIKKLTATFTAKTDTTFGPNYSIFKLTQGIINIDYK